MFGPDLDGKESQLEKDGYSLSKGLWSFVFTGRPGDDKRFFNLYAEHIDKTAVEDWHCIGFARKILPITSAKTEWRSDPLWHEESKKIRNSIKSGLILPWDAAIVFFNPFTIVNEGFGVVIPLNDARLAQTEVIKEDLDAITECVRRSRGADQEDVRTRYGTDQRLRVLHSALLRKKALRVLEAVFDKTIGPALGAFFGLAR